LFGSRPAGYAEGVVAARYTNSVDRYGHFALGKPHEYSTVELPENLVFEDLEPRIVRVAAGAAPHLLAAVSGRDGGARLMLMQQVGDGLVAAAQSAPIGTAMPWMNPVAVADLDGDGQIEIAAVITPHIGGTLKIFRMEGKHLVELGLATVVEVAGRLILVVPDSMRRRLRMVASKPRGTMTSIPIIPAGSSARCHPWSGPRRRGGQTRGWPRWGRRPAAPGDRGGVHRRPRGVAGILPNLLHEHRRKELGHDPRRVRRPALATIGFMMQVYRGVEDVFWVRSDPVVYAGSRRGRESCRGHGDLESRLLRGHGN
jgi:hypothetical protein